MAGDVRQRRKERLPRRQGTRRETRSRRADQKSQGISAAGTTCAMKEVWKQVPRFRRYRISNLGRVRGQKGALLKPGISGSGYRFVWLCNTQGKKIKSVHRLVAKAFVPGRGRDVNHKDGNKRRNIWTNLEWISRSGNQRHAADIGLKPSGMKSHLCTKLDSRRVRVIRGLAPIMSQARIGKIFGISQTYVGKIIKRTKWRQLK